MTRITCILILWFVAINANSAAAVINAQFDLKISKLAKSQQWLDLIHYKKSHLAQAQGPQSAINERFYLSASVKVDPEEELRALIKALLNSQEEISCRFPARTFWLENQFPEMNFKNIVCIEFQEWFDSIAAESLSLIYPVAYLNSPSSMFGHTFIRLDSSRSNSELVDYSVSYAASSQTEKNDLLFLFKGLTGGVPGVFSILPYYEKVKEYSYLESRDVWSYKLNLDQEEVDQFVRHLWEIKDIHFNYYFFDENCSYQVLNLLDAASERLQLAQQFSHKTIPADTVKAITSRGLVSQVSYRPSALSSMQSKIEMMEPKLRELVKELVNSDRNIDQMIGHYANATQAQVLDLAYEYSRYRANQLKVYDKNLAKRSINILSARSKLKLEGKVVNYQLEEKSENTSLTSPIRHDEGHSSSRIQATFGYDGNNHYLQTGIRAAYHDHLDSISGYDLGAQLEMFDFILRRIDLERGHTTRLESLTLIDIRSNSPRNSFVKPWSWSVYLGLERPRAQATELTPSMNLSRGLAYSALDQIVYLMIEGQLNVDSGLSKGHYFGIGPRLGLLSQFQTFSSKIEAFQYFDVLGAEYRLRSLRWEFAKTLDQSWQFRFGASANWYKDQGTLNSKDSSEFSIGLVHYF